MSFLSQNPICKSCNKIQSLQIGKCNYIHSCCQNNCQHENIFQNLQLVITSSVISQLKLRSPPIKKANNLIKQSLEGRIFSNFSLYLFNFKGHSYIPCATLQTNRSLEFCTKNYNYLAIDIRQSKIKEAGHGLFATKLFKENMLLGVYAGKYRTHNETKNSDSNFTVGWIEKEQFFYQIINDASQVCNCTRFINGAKNGEQNCEAKLQIIQRQGKYYPQILIFTIKQVKQNEQFLLNYGQEYW